MKTCTGCDATKPLSEYWRDKRPGRGAKARCIDCTRASNQRYQATNSTRIRKTARDKYEADPLPSRERHLVRKYGVTSEVYEKMLADQKGGCAICNDTAADQNNGRLHVDHDHNTGAVRGLLCVSCNRMLGFSRDNALTLAVGIAYLAKHRSRPA